MPAGSESAAAAEGGGQRATCVNYLFIYWNSLPFTQCFCELALVQNRDENRLVGENVEKVSRVQHSSFLFAALAEDLFTVSVKFQQGLVKFGQPGRLDLCTLQFF